MPDEAFCTINICTNVIAMFCVQFHRTDGISNALMNTFYKYIGLQILLDAIFMEELKKFKRWLRAVIKNCNARLKISKKPVMINRERDVLRFLVEYGNSSNQQVATSIMDSPWAKEVHFIHLPGTQNRSVFGIGHILSRNFFVFFRSGSFQHTLTKLIPCWEYRKKSGWCVSSVLDGMIKILAWYHARMLKKV
jgi:hypothetical protein